LTPSVKNPKRCLRSSRPQRMPKRELRRRKRGKAAFKKKIAIWENRQGKCGGRRRSLVYFTKKRGGTNSKLVNISENRKTKTVVNRQPSSVQKEPRAPSPPEKGEEYSAGSKI